MLEIESYQLGPLETNCYVLTDTQLDETVIIDPADSGDFISAELLHNHRNLKEIWLTHGHIDHIMAVTELVLNFDVPYFIHGDDQFLLDRAVTTAQHWFGTDILPLPPSQHFSTVLTPTIGQYQFSILEAPGHTPGSVAFYCQPEQLLICGDTVFASGAIGRTDFSYSSHEELRNSLKKLTHLPAETRMLPGHGESDKLGLSLSQLDDVFLM